MGSLAKLLVVIEILGLCNMIRGNPNTNVTAVLYNSRRYTRGDPFATSLAYVIAELEAITPPRMGHDYHNISPFPNAFAFGHATCNASLSDCATCLHSAVQHLVDTCNNCIGAQAILYDCYIRYEQYPFNG
ncbi:antifungal protein ginkbilobin-like protein 1 [Tasmannia lanceolata]|uniref:antifungal protein ginkbilobin-like protein 1 n=1 Tax=Tasmannia lanceolata TaxID=3420 RepID=UPI004064186D